MMSSEEDIYPRSTRRQYGAPLPNEWPVIEPPGAVRIAIVGSMPTKNEDYYSKLFIGEAGKFLDAGLGKEGLVRAQCLLCNVSWVRSERGYLDEFEWDGNEIQCSLKHLEEDLEKFNPTIVLCLGNEALHVMKVGNVEPERRKGLFDWPHKIQTARGTLFESSFRPGQKCLGVLHPNNILKDFSDQSYFAFDMEKLKREAGSKELKLPKREIKVLKTIDAVEDKLWEVDCWDYCAIDIEGSQSNITCISFSCNPDFAYVVPFAHYDGSSFWGEEEEIRAWVLVRSIIENEEVKKIAQNGTYDFYALAFGLGICVEGYEHDTIIAWWELYPEMKKGLATQVSILTNEPYYKPDKAHGGLKFNSDEHFWRYNGIDSAVTYECWLEEMRRMDAGQRKHYAFNMELQGGPVLYMMLRGILFDVEKAKKLQESTRTEVSKLQRLIDKESGITFSCEEKNGDFSDVLQIVRNEFCSKRIKKAEMVSVERWKPMKWNGKRWVKKGPLVMVTPTDGPVFDNDESARKRGVVVGAIYVKAFVTKEKLVDFEPKNFKECDEFVLSSKRERWIETKGIIARIRSEGVSEELLGELSIKLGVAVNVGSTQLDGDSQTFLYGTCKLPRVFINKRGQFSTEEPAAHRNRVENGVVKSHADKKVVSSMQALAKLYAKTEDVRALWVLQIRRLRKIVTDLNVKLDEDSRCRASISLVKETGRMAESKTPAGTGLNRQALNKDLREICVADPKSSLYQFDLEGADNWTVAAECAKLGDNTMLEDLRAGLKPAKILSLIVHIGADKVRGLIRNEIKQELRDAKDMPGWLYPACKAGVHGSSYLMGWVTMGETVLKHSLHTLPLDLSSASPLILKKKNIETIQEAFFSRWKGVKKWHEAVSKNLLDNGYAQTSVGHRRTFMGRKAEYRQGAKLANRETLKEALSTLPQFYTTYATKLALWMLWFDPENRTEYGDLKLEPILCVHDSLLGQAKDVYEEWAKARIKTYFDNEIEIAGIPITIPAEGTIGRDWGMKDEVII